MNIFQKIIKKNPKEPVEFIRPWSTYICSCQENCMNCLCVPICLPCFMCELFHYVFGYRWWPSLAAGIMLTPFAPFIIMAARIVLRRKHQLQGNFFADILCTILCFLNSACQVRDEIHTLRRDHIWELDNPPPPGEPEHSPYILPIIEAYGELRECGKKEESNDEESESTDSENDSEISTSETENSSTSESEACTTESDSV